MIAYIENCLCYWFCRNGVTTAGHTNRVFAVKWHPSDINITLSGGWDNTIQVRHLIPAESARRHHQENVLSLLRIFCEKMLWKLEIMDLQLCTRISTPLWISSWLISPSVVSLDMGCKSRIICSKSTRNTNLWRRSWHEGWKWSCLDWVMAGQQPTPGQFSGSNKNSSSWSTSTYLNGFSSMSSYWNEEVKKFPRKRWNVNPFNQGINYFSLWHKPRIRNIASNWQG
jgi:hypothetical protein